MGVGGQNREPGLGLILKAGCGCEAGLRIRETRESGEVMA